MLKSEKYKFLFVHVYKNAGTSITEALMPYAAGQCMQFINRINKKVALPFVDVPQPFHSHISAIELIDKLGEDEFKKYFSFAFVRNPWDWQVSLYKFMLKDKYHYQHEFIKGLGGFEQYLQWRCSGNVRLQKDFICSRTGRVALNFVGKYENLAVDFKKICSEVGIVADLPWRNSSGEKNYRDFYNEKTKLLVEESFKDDIDLFGYSF
ncbi:hypothetical protein GCM10011352_36350 [Marinobacterium zhoushanense]|uniref:Sulfotransferase family protein n=1 Tax=Marinobacterium zhoushanense TaxID=1679163 RepID=A0ABQ1KT75_9GAMM|nr:sulfotransferase family 2 domain-containing protein [Marinobacterium zhoushanense]GGC06843.1 hypothetical protein GCM10011352_36350 [Marinobacterium zhoushanense]